MNGKSDRMEAPNLVTSPWPNYVQALVLSGLNVAENNSEGIKLIEPLC